LKQKKSEELNILKIKKFSSQINGDKVELTEIKGIGKRLAKKIIENFGNEEQLLKAIHNYQINRIAQIEGVSQRMATDIVNHVLGNPAEEFLKTERSHKIYEDIIQRILEYSNTEYGKNRILLINPTKDKEKIQETLVFVMKAKEMVSTLPVNDVINLLKKIGPAKKDRPKYDSSKAVLVESVGDYNSTMDMNLNEYCPIITSEELETIENYEFIVYIYGEGKIELSDSFNIVMVKNDAQEFEIVPEVVLSYFYDNHDLLNNILTLKEILGRDSVLPEVMDILDSLKLYSVDEAVFDDVVEAAKHKADEKLRQNIKKVDLKGEEVLKILNEDMPDKIQKIFDDAINDAKEKIKEKTGYSFDPFIQKYPIEIDQQELGRIKKLKAAEMHINAFEKKVEAASRLSELKSAVEYEIGEILDFDYEFALGCFAHYYDLNQPEIKDGPEDGFYFKDAIHLNLALKPNEEVQKIEYILRKPENVVLLTGANSGGKTTLIETMAQISIMTQMGLPVCAQEAEVKIVEEIYLFSQKRTLDAGAFESFLRTFIPIVTEKPNKLVLLDELEAITELEAASKIISSFIDFMKDSDSYAVIVTHMAPDILKYVDVRVDGIEAEGLDENYNLIVNRTPKMNYLAKSTPELILRMIYEKSDGKLREIYGKILDKF